jgi:hypothetical protein
MTVSSGIVAGGEEVLIGVGFVWDRLDFRGKLSLEDES